MLEAIKLALRWKNNDFDTEIKIYINSCKNDLVLGGVNRDKLLDDDESWQAVAIAYCKWQLNFQGEGERWGRIYMGLKTSLVINANYH